LNSAREQASPGAAKKTSATGGTAQKELTPLEGAFRLQSSHAHERNNTTAKKRCTWQCHGF